MTEEKQLLVPQDDYLKSGIHIGTKFKTKYMENFIYKTRPDGLCVLNLQKIDDRLRVAARFLAKYEPNEILMVCRRENGWDGLKLLGKMTGIKVIPGRYPPGMLTNPDLETFKEFKLVFVADAWPDRNVVQDAVHVGIPVVALCDTNNQSNFIDLVLPCNNKGRKSLGLVFYILAREYLKVRGVIKSDEEFQAKPADFIGE